MFAAHPAEYENYLQTLGIQTDKRLVGYIHADRHSQTGRYTDIQIEKDERLVGYRHTDRQPAWQIH